MTGGRWMPAILVLATACSATPASLDTTAPGPDTGAVATRFDELRAHIDTWGSDPDLATVHRAAEAVANLVVGPTGPGYGDRDGDREVVGVSDVGVLPGLEGEPAGLAARAIAAGGDPVCVERDVLGGPWDQPAERWRQIDDVLARWEPGNNTMPELASHPQRMVGWALLTLGADDLETAHEFARHARLHLDVSQRAFDC